MNTKNIEARNGRAAMVISLDFELYWGMRHLPSVNSYVRNLIGARIAIPAILELFREYGIHATWATVGFLFFERTSQLLKIAPTRRPLYKNTKLDPYSDLPPESEHETSDSIFFAPSLIRMIAKTTNQEIATHSFSHYYSFEDGADIESFRADLHSAQRAARLSNFEVTSLVFPKNQERRDFLEVCAEAGILAKRGQLLRLADSRYWTPSKNSSKPIFTALFIAPGLFGTASSCAHQKRPDSCGKKGTALSPVVASAQLWLRLSSEL